MVRVVRVSCEVDPRYYSDQLSREGEDIDYLLDAFDDLLAFNAKRKSGSAKYDNKGKEGKSRSV